MHLQTDSRDIYIYVSIYTHTDINAVHHSRSLTSSHADIFLVLSGIHACHLAPLQSGDAAF